MTTGELKAECERVLGQSLTFVQLVLPGRMPAKSDRKRLWKNGPIGRAIGEVGRGVLVECDAKEVLEALTMANWGDAEARR